MHSGSLGGFTGEGENVQGQADLKSWTSLLIPSKIVSEIHMRWDERAEQSLKDPKRTSRQTFPSSTTKAEAHQIRLAACRTHPSVETSLILEDWRRLRSFDTPSKLTLLPTSTETEEAHPSPGLWNGENFLARWGRMAAHFPRREGSRRVGA